MSKICHKCEDKYICGTFFFGCKYDNGKMKGGE